MIFDEEESAGEIMEKRNKLLRGLSLGDFSDPSSDSRKGRRLGDQPCVSSEESAESARITSHSPDDRIIVFFYLLDVSGNFICGVLRIEAEESRPSPDAIQEM